ncbi:MAG: hypothetical protein D6693_03440 [Planctomycetota bacterium]|nr:MAG: hypothetical protein D6693_03440 [Planctomycetota bacterium]
MQHTRVNPKWLVKIVVFTVLLAGLGAWGLYDALYAYPKRGEASALFSKYEYLRAARDSNELSRASVDDPRAELERLEGIRVELSQQAEGDTPAARRAQTQLKRLQWLEALRAIGALDPDRTRIAQPTAELNELDSALAGQVPPKPLAAWDIPLQWVFVVVGFGGALWLVVLILRVRAARYGFDPETRTLTLPGGRTIAPGDLAELDKRKWDKFLVKVLVKEGAPVRLDLLRHTPLEDWILEMERAAGLAPEPEPESGSESESEAAPAEPIEDRPEPGVAPR